MIILSGKSYSVRFDIDSKNNLEYYYELLPSSNFQTVSSALTLDYHMPNKFGIELSYLSFDSAVLLGQSSMVSYHLTYYGRKYGNITPIYLFGYRFIYTPELGYSTPIDFGITPQIDIGDDYYVSFPVVISLFSRSNLLDISFDFGRRGFLFGDFVAGVRSLKSITNPTALDRVFFMLGFRG